MTIVADESDDGSVPLPPIGIGPKEAKRKFLRRHWRSAKPQTRIALVYLAPLLVVGALALERTIQMVGWAVAFDILTGSVAPSGTHVGGWGMVLAGVGYLIVPALASLMIASVWNGRPRSGVRE